MQISLDERRLLWIALIVGAILLRNQLIATLIPFLLAVAVAALLEPLVDVLHQRARLPRSLAATISLIVALLAGGVIFLVVIAKVIAELVHMGGQLQRYQRFPVELATQAIDRLNQLNELFDREGLPLEVQRNLLQTVDNIARASVDALSQAISFVLKAITQLPFLLVVGVVALLATYFLVKDRDRLIEAMLSRSSPKARDQLLAAWQRVIADLVGYVKAQFILIMITTVTVAVGLLIIGVGPWVTLALLAGFLDFVPILGPGFLFVPWAIAALLLGDMALAVKLLVLLGLSFILRQVFQAKVLGDSIGIHPLYMLVALYAGIHFFSVQGFIAAPILVIIVKAIFSLRDQPQLAPDPRGDVADLHPVLSQEKG